MKKIAILILLLILVGGVTFFATRESQPHTDNAAQDSIIVGTESNYPPFEFIKDGKLTGFEIEMVEEIGQRLGKKIVFKDMAFDNLLFAAKSGNVQVIAAGLTPTPEREEQVLFTTSFLSQSPNPLVIVSLPDHPLSTIEELKGKEVIVNDGFVAETFLSVHKEILLKKLPTPVEAFMALKNGRAAAYVVANETAQSYLRKEGFGPFAVHELPFNEDSALGVSKLHLPLRDAINGVLAAMIADGSLQKLKEKWHMNSDKK